MTRNTEQDARTGGSSRKAAITQAVASGMPLVNFFDDVEEETANAVTKMVEAAAAIAATASPAGNDSVEGDPLMLAFAELGAIPWSQRPVRRPRSSLQRRHAPLTLDRKEAQLASKGTPKYPLVVLDGESLDGNAIALVAAVMSAMRDAGIPDEEVDTVPNEALSKDYSHVLQTITGLVTIRWQSKSRHIEIRASGDASAQASVNKMGAAEPSTSSPNPFVSVMYDRWEPPSLQAFLDDLQPEKRGHAICQNAASKEVLSVISLDDVDDAALGQFPVLRSLREHVGGGDAVAQLADMLYGMDQPATFISLTMERLDTILERVGTKSAVEIALSFAPSDDAVWVDTTCNGQQVGLLAFRSCAGWLHLRRVEFDGTGALRCLPVGIVRMHVHEPVVVDWDAVGGSPSTPDADTNRHLAIALYYFTSSEALEPGIDRDAAEPFYGARCRDLIRVALAASPLCQ